MRKLTNSDFISRCKKVHLNTYNYSKTNYINNRNDIIIICSVHGELLISPKGHLIGQGCYKCGIINREKKRIRISNNEFINKLKNTHHNIYDYSLVEYKNMRSKINIICPVHGLFSMKAQNHVLGQGCRQCSSDLSSFIKDDWIKKAKNRNGIFYIIECWDEEEYFYKFGITFNKLKNRYGGTYAMPYSWKILREIKSEDLNYIWNLEKRFKRSKVKNHYKPFKYFPGSAWECFKI